MARILLLLTKTPWNDFRQFDHQGPALVEGEHEVLYAAAPPDRGTQHPFTWIELSDRERKLARRSGGLNLLRRISALRPALVQLCSLELLPLGLALKALSRTKVVYDCREDMASGVFERRKNLPMWARRALFRGVRALENRAAKRFDGIVTADPAVLAMHAAMPDERKHVYYNTALLSQFPRDYAPLWNRPFEIAVLGSLESTRSGIHTVLDAMGLLKERGISLRALFVGQPRGEVVPALERRITKYGLEDRVTITGQLPHAAVAGTLAQGRIGIVPLLDYPKFHHNIACKAFEYMACGMPIVATDLPPQHLFLHPGVAVFYPCGDVVRLAERIEELLKAPERCAAMGEQGRRDVETRWNGEREQEGLRRFYAQLLEWPPRDEV